MTDTIRICFVCLGNICRSPTAEGVMLHLVREAGLGDRFEIDSAGTGAYHVGERADGRSRQEARARGISLDSRARQFVAADFSRFDYVVAMDRQNLRNLRALGDGEAALAKLHLLRDFVHGGAAEGPERDVPDPYYGGERGFVEVFDIVEAGCRALLAEVRTRHGL